MRSIEPSKPNLLSYWQTARLTVDGVRLALVVSMVLLAIAPVFLPDSYSPFEHTLSESGAQGVATAFVFRSALIITASAVLVMTMHARVTWSGTARVWLRVYALAVVALAVFPESPWLGGAHDERIAFLHTVAGVVGGLAFIVGIVGVSVSGLRGPRARVLDIVMVGAVMVTPQLMLMTPAAAGMLQRAMVLLGYIWLLSEAQRMVDATVTAPSSVPVVDAG